MRSAARSRRLVPVSLTAVAIVLVSGCTALVPFSSDGDSAGADGSAGSVGNLDDVRSAVVQIAAEGTFVDPEQGQLSNVAGSGTGFIIDPQGIAVTNNHVVTGAALLNVYVDGEEGPRNARVLGVSECSDLAVIDIDGEGFPSLGWSQDVPSVGTDVYAAGYPLGDPEFTLTRGIVSKESALGETSWASVDSVLEHDATINPGNSGGPLINSDAQVVGVNYAGSSQTGQYFAITAAEARGLVERLRAEEDVTSIGVNGEAFVLEDGSSGIWVSSVESGSPAGSAGVQGGDIITRLENLIVGDDGTMSDYCDVLRSNTANDVLALEVLRASTGEVLAGEVNGDELEVSVSFAQELQGEATTDTGGGASYGEYVQITDDSGAITVSVPAEWADVDGSPLSFDDGTQWPSLQTSPDLATFSAGWDVPGAVLTATSELAGSSPDELLDTLGPEVTGGACTLVGREPYDDGLYTGSYDTYEQCGGTGTVLVTIAAEPADGSFLVWVGVQATSDRDLEALDQIIDTFIVSGSV